MKIHFLVGGLLAFSSVCCYADDWSVSRDQFPQMADTIVVLAQDRSSMSLGVSDVILTKIMNEKNHYASFLENSWLFTADVDKSGLVLQRQEGALHLQYRF